MLGGGLLTLPVGPLHMDDPDFGDHQMATKHSRYLADWIQHFRRRWQQEYLVDLREFHRPKNKNVILPPVKIGDIVILHDQKTTQRAFWKVTRVAELIKGRDGEVRGSTSVGRKWCRKEFTNRETPPGVISSRRYKPATQVQLIRLGIRLGLRQTKLAKWMKASQLDRKPRRTAAVVCRGEKSSLLTTC